MNRTHLQSELRRGVAPLELVMVLPIIWLLFICALYVGWAAMITFQNESICRNTAWKQRTEPGSDVRPFMFGDATAGLIEEERTEPIKTGLILDRWKHTAKAKHVILARTWDFQDLEKFSNGPWNKSQLYSHQPFLQLLNGDNLLDLKSIFDDLKGKIIKAFSDFARTQIEEYLKKKTGKYDPSAIKDRVKEAEQDADNATENLPQEATKDGKPVTVEKMKDEEKKYRRKAKELEAKLNDIPDHGGIDLARLTKDRETNLTGLSLFDLYELSQAPDTKSAFRILFKREIENHSKHLEELAKEYATAQVHLPDTMTLEDYIAGKQKNETPQQKQNRLVFENKEMMSEYLETLHLIANTQKTIKAMEETEKYKEKPDFGINKNTYYDD